MIGEIIIEFRDNNKDIFYEGESFLRKGKSDSISISKSSIKLLFTRTKRVDISYILTSDRSLYRYQIHKALCFYLAVVGELPAVDKIIVTQGDERVVLPHENFTTSWNNCRCEVRFKPSDLEVIFKDKAYSKAMYIALTYWLKAQLDPFINDKFRSLWSGFNSLYGNIYPQDQYREYQQLNNFREKFMKEEDYVNSIVYLSEVEDEFLEKIEWYNYIINEKSLDKVNYASTLLETFPDRRINGLISKYAAGLKKDKPAVISAIAEVAATKESLNVDYFIQLKFLLTKYIYLVRNRYFHGNKEYPLFLIGEMENKNEQILCSILNVAVADTIKAIAKRGYNKQNV